MKKIVFAAALALCGLSSAAQAAGCDTPFCQGSGRGLFGGGRQPMPAFQAAPWYLYWPYNSHFMTPSPMQGAYSAPPYHGGGMVNPYFPGGGYGVPAGAGYGPAPSGNGIYNPPAPMPSTTPAPITPAPGVTPSVTPGVSVPVIPAVPNVIRASGRR